MKELILVLETAGYTLLAVIMLHGVVRVISKAYFKSKHEYLRRVKQDG